MDNTEARKGFHIKLRRFYHAGKYSPSNSGLADLTRKKGGRSDLGDIRPPVKGRVTVVTRYPAGISPPGNTTDFAREISGFKGRSRQARRMGRILPNSVRRGREHA